MTDTLSELFKQHFGSAPKSIAPLPQSGSNRRNYRITGEQATVIGTIGTSFQENNAFISMARHFRACGLNVPEVLEVSGDGMSYLQQDLGGVSLFDFISTGRDSDTLAPQAEEMLSKTIKALAKFQFEGARGLDFNVCYPEKDFSVRSIMFDLNYFKYCFLKTSGVEFDEVLLQDDFEKLQADLIATGSGDTFLYRDFQARNVMVCNGEPWFIDFQGGRRGPVYYDVASFVWQAKAKYPDSLKRKLVADYLEALKGYTQVDEDVFMSNLSLFVLFRLLQVLGAYGFRGYIEKKSHFLESIPYAMENLKSLLERPLDRYPYLDEVLRRLLASYRSSIEVYTDGKLHIDVCSFSYKKGYPQDKSGNGGGFVFDCRGMANPGRYEFYKQFTGLDSEVIKFIEDDGAVVGFLDNAEGMVLPHARMFVQRGFTHLSVAFGCTGGRHRSVYCAEHMGQRLKAALGDSAVIRVIHREQGIDKIL